MNASEGNYVPVSDIDPAHYAMNIFDNCAKEFGVQPEVLDTTKAKNLQDKAYEDLIEKRLQRNSAGGTRLKKTRKHKHNKKHKKV